MGEMEIYDIALLRKILKEILLNIMIRAAIYLNPMNKNGWLSGSMYLFLQMFLLHSGNAT